MPTIFITSFHVLISRNILATGFLSLLSQRCRIVILVPDFKKEYFLREFGGQNIVVEGVSAELARSDIFLRQLALALTNTNDLYIKKRVQLFEEGIFLRFLIYIAPAFLLRGSRIAVLLLRTANYLFLHSKTFDPLLSKYNPDLVFSTDVQNELDVRLLSEAKNCGIKTLGMVRSWDNLTSKGILRILPDHFVVNNEVVKDHLIKYNFVNPDKISTVGIPHYDKYVSFEPILRDDFFRKFDFDKNKKLILFAPIGDRYVRQNNTDKYALEALSELDANILVRLPPMDSVNLDGFKSRGAKVFLQKTGTSSWKGGAKLNEISKEDDKELVLALRHADVVVTFQSTISVDAAVFGKPSVIVRFDSLERSGVYWDSVRRYYDYDYYAEYAKTGELKFADNSKELKKMAMDYLKNPSLNKEGVRRIVKTQAYLADGQSAKRLADVIMKHVT